MAYATEVYRTRGEMIERLAQLDGIRHVTHYTEAVRRSDGAYITSYIVAYPGDLKLPKELRPTGMDEELAVEQSSDGADLKNPTSADTTT